MLDVVVGTHALISDSVTFFRLGLVITDEQHRFGVEQRAALVRKGEQPHTLVMSATPIPRTLALLVYGDLDVSIIDELPPGRQPVQTVCVDERYRARLNAFIDKLIGEGRQVFVVCPKVEETDDVPSDLKSAEEHAQVLQRTFPQHRVACIHGRMKARDKDACMAAFAAGETDILVSTTVIEVGVDVPNAAYFQDTASHNEKTKMMVAHVDRFDTIIVRSEFEALVLENSLIKRHMPRYNILLKDDKGYPFVRLDEKSSYPRFTLVNRTADDGAKYYGPFGGRHETRLALDAVCAALRLPTCSPKVPPGHRQGAPLPELPHGPV